MAFGELLVGILFILLLVGGVVLALVLAQKRRKALVELAARLGLSFSPEAEFVPGFREYEAMKPGSRPRVCNQMAGAYKGRDVRCFEFKYTVQQGKSQSTRTRGVVLARVPSSWPRLRIVPESLGYKIMDALGAEDVDFESQEFSDRFWVTSPDRRFAYDAIDPRMMELLLESPLSRWEIAYGLLVAWEDGSWSPDEFQRSLDALVAFLDRVPKHVWEERP
jgi:hypothetical protein